MKTIFTRLSLLRPQIVVGRSGVVALLMVLSGHNLSTYAQQAAITAKSFIYEKAPFPECHASTIEVAPNGQLVASWFGGTEEGNKDVEIWFSRRDPRNETQWSTPVMVADGLEDGKRYPCWNPVLITMGDRLVLFYKVGPSPSTWWGLWKESLDSGATWSAAHRLETPFLGPIKNKPLLLKDGRLLCGSSSEHDGWKAHIEFADSKLNQWKFVGPLNEKGQIESIQPTFLQLKDGSLLMLCRTKSEQKISITTSKNLGESWDKMSLLDLPNPNSGIDAVSLPDGRHLLVYNHTIRDPKRPGAARAQLNLAVSDDGLHWKAVAQLENEEQGEFSYPAIIVDKEGQVQITYTWNRQKVRHLTVDPKKIVGTPLTDSKWPGNPEVNLAQ